MKTLLAIFAILAGCYLMLDGTNDKGGIIGKPALEHSGTALKPPINVVFFQDVSGSIAQNGIELVSSSVFEPYFDDTARKIELCFGVIAGDKGRKLISLSLLPQALSKPLIPDTKELSITERRKLTAEYSEESKAFLRERDGYFAKRKLSIYEFCRSVDSLIAIYKIRLSPETDLETAVLIADKAFNAAETGTRNCLILNSDGMDSKKRTITRMNNKALVMLTNADGIAHTSIDSILSTTLESPEKAILSSLRD